MKIEENINAHLKIEFSKESEILRIKHTLGRLAWFKERKYMINLPTSIQSIINNKLEPTDKDILEAVDAEFNLAVYKKKTNELTGGWNTEKSFFLSRLILLGQPLQQEYCVLLTKYGVGGSYAFPNIITINFDYLNENDAFSIMLHEIIHITIEGLIQRYKIDHWAKERLVDLIYSEFFPAKAKLQRNPENAEKIGEIFKNYFPDVEKVIVEIGKLKKC